MLTANARRQSQGWNPDRVDPTRTTMLRRAWLADLRRRFAKVRREIMKLVKVEDAFGLTANLASTQIDLPQLRLEIERMQARLDPADVLKLEDNPHVTVFYGLVDETEVEAVQDALSGSGWVKARIGSLSLFESDEQDVLKLDVDSADLLRLHEKLDELPNRRTHADYRPHVTVAYLKPGTGRRYLDLPNPMLGSVVGSRTVQFSDPDRVKTPVTLNCGGKGGTPGPCPHPHVVAKLAAALKSKIKSSYAKLAERYGHRGAVAMLGAMAMTFPIPGNVVGVIGAAEGIRGIHKLIARNEEHGFSDAMLDEMAAEVAEHVRHVYEQVGESAPIIDLNFVRQKLVDALNPQVANCGGEGGTPGPCKSLHDVKAARHELSHAEIADQVREHFAGKSKAEARASLKEFGIVTPPRSKAHAVEMATRKISELKESAERTAEIGAKPQPRESGTALPFNLKDRKVGEREEMFGFHPTMPKRTDNAARWQFMASPDQLKQFSEWLKRLLASELVGRTENELWAKYVQQGFAKGAGRSFDDVKQSQLRKERPDLFMPGQQESLRDFYEGTKQEFLRSAFGRPVAIEKVKLLASRTYEDLKTVAAGMESKIRRALVDGLIAGGHPRDIAQEMAGYVDGGLASAERIARTETTRAHAQGQLLALREMGVDRLGVMVEWAIVNDNAVCPLCKPLDGVVLKMDEAEAMLPRHPNCRCAWIPANIDEDAEEEGQKVTKGQIERSLRKSVRLEGGEGASRWLGADRIGTISKSRPASVVGNAWSDEARAAALEARRDGGLVY